MRNGGGFLVSRGLVARLYTLSNMGNSQSHTNPATAGVLRLKRNILKFSSEHTVDSVREKAGLLDTEHEVKGATFNEFKLTFDTMAFLSVAVLSCAIHL